MFCMCFFIKLKSLEFMFENFFTANKLGAKRYKSPRMDGIPTTSSYPAPFHPFNQYPPAGPPSAGPMYPNHEENRYNPAAAPQGSFQ